MMFSTLRGLFQKRSKENGKLMGRRERERGREWGREHCRSERRLGICRRLYATFLILISTENATKNKSTFWLAFLPYFFLHFFFGFFCRNFPLALMMLNFWFLFFFFCFRASLSIISFIWASFEPNILWLLKNILAPFFHVCICCCCCC